MYIEPNSYSGPNTNRKRTNPIRLFFIGFLLLAILSTIGCTKNEADSPVADEDSLADYHIFDQNRGCYSFLNVIYEVGRPSNWLGSDTVTIVVSVQKPGYWEVKPVTISGLEFAGSGYLKDTGENILKIPVTGIPTTAGRFDFPLDMGALLCTPIVVIVPAGTFPPPPTTTYYYRATIGGKQYIEEVKPGNGIIAGSGVNGSNEVTFTASVGPDAYPYPIGKTSLSITKGTMFNFYSATIPQFLGFFSPAYYPYANGPSFSPFQNSNGLIVEWMDPQGNTWASYEGSGTQGGNASMKIASAVASPDPINYYVKTRIEFACRLYKQGTGEMMELTGGEFVGLFGPL